MISVTSIKKIFSKTYCEDYSDFKKIFKGTLKKHAPKKTKIFQRNQNLTKVKQFTS